MHTVHSPSFKHFLPKASSNKVPEEFYYAYCVLVKHDLLNSQSVARSLA